MEKYKCMPKIPVIYKLFLYIVQLQLFFFISLLNDKLQTWHLSLKYSWMSFYVTTVKKQKSTSTKSAPAACLDKCSLQYNCE